MKWWYVRSALYTLTSQANQLASEESVEAIVRKRTLDGEQGDSDLGVADDQPSKRDARFSLRPLARHRAVGGT